ncbi:MAG: hypothetical protein LBD75_00355 [Candidatus Peribacteria bacterium]|jgi:hypothetical protein|nr:hypothetical protein [Candidatus Peribacteria bacterium]
MKAGIRGRLVAIGLIGGILVDYKVKRRRISSPMVVSIRILEEIKRGNATKNTIKYIHYMLYK